MKMNDLVTIVVPVYNLAEHVEKCIDMLLKQTYKNTEIILVDDGSKDNSLNIMNKYKSEQVKVIHQENAGAAAARNNGISEAHGKYIAFIDGDDWIDDNFVELMVNKMEDMDADLVVCDYLVEPYDNSQTELISLKLEEAKIYSIKKTPYIINSIGNAPWNKLYRTQIIKDNKISFLEGYRHHDLAFTQHYLINSSRVVYLKKALNHYLKDRPNNISTAFDNKIGHIIVMLDYLMARYNEKDMFEENYEELKFLAVSNLVVSLRKIRNISDKVFVYEYIDRVFNWLDVNFSDYKNSSYFDICSKNDRIYRKSWTTKLYYRYARLKKMGR